MENFLQVCDLALNLHFPIDGVLLLVGMLDQTGFRLIKFVLCLLSCNVLLKEATFV